MTFNIHHASRNSRNGKIAFNNGGHRACVVEIDGRLHLTGYGMTNKLPVSIEYERAIRAAVQS